MRVSGSTTNVSVSCSGDPGAVCKLSFALTVIETIRRSKVIAVSAGSRTAPASRKKQLTLGATTITIMAGSKQTVPVSLNRRGQILLGRYRVLRVHFGISQIGAGLEGALATIPVTIHASPKAKRKR